MRVELLGLNSSYSHTAVALYYLKANAEDIADIHITEFTINDDIYTIAGSVYSNHPDIIGISCYIWNMELIWRLCQIFKKILPEAVIILGGPEVSYDAELLLRDHEDVDYIICGEGERVFRELLLRLDKGIKAVDDIDGVYCRYNERILGHGFSIVNDLNDTPPIYDGINSTDFANKILYCETSRGCPFNCAYCLSSTTNGVRYVPMDKVKRELASIMLSGAKQVKFLDRTFNAHKRRAMEIWDFILNYAARPEGMRFHFEICADIIDDEMLNFLVNVPRGVFQFEIGVQSVANRTLTAVKRRMDLDRLAHVVAVLRAHNNIDLHLDLIAGLPYEDFDSFGRSFDYVYSLKPHVLQLGFLKLLKGSILRQQAHQFGYAFDVYPPYEVLYSADMSFDDLQRLHWVEDALDRYYNAHRMDHTLNYIIQNFHRGAFDFYKTFGRYWYQCGYYGKGHKDEALYRIMLDYSNNVGYEPKAFIKELVRLDYLIHHPSMSHPSWAISHGDKKFEDIKKAFFCDNSLVRKYTPQFVGFEPKIIKRYVYVEPFDYNVLEVISSCYTVKPISKLEWLLIDSSTGNIYDVSRET